MSNSSIRDITLWVRRYAQNRSVPMLLSLAVFMVLVAGICGFAHLARKAYQSGQFGQSAWFTAITAIFVIADLFVSTPRFGGRWIAALCEKFSTERGSVELSANRPHRGLRWLGVAFALCVVGSVIAGHSGLISSRFMVPVTAAYVVPFLTALVFAQRPKASYLLLLWPALYAVHAISILAGAPVFAGRWAGLNYLLPTFGYGLLTAVVAQVYSSYALLRLKRLSKLDGATEGDQNG